MSLALDVTAGPTAVPPGAGSWRRDFRTEWTTSGTTGGTLWEAAFRMADFLEGSDLFADMPGAKVLELGSGCGWLGVCVALNNPEVEVVMTDQEVEGQLEWTQHNVDICGTPLKNIACKPLDWTVGNDAVTGVAWDVIIGSDLVYNEAGVEMLPPLLARLLGSGGSFLYAHTRYRYEDSDMTFLQRLGEHGLQVREVWLPDAATPPPSPPPMSSVFPEKRIAIWEITKDGAPPRPAPRFRRAERAPTDVVSFFQLGDDS
eukprot:TRINITY_DN5160_c0_g4_i1.p1 TRINITY_DN5160_c0_g4~~TRINITY_DN5160_c0_g4_i1.p1  ORF type:complete len:259 (+),score=79.65 TRINITY_DN5160_c0_g4_i1:49-825(+)